MYPIWPENVLGWRTWPGRGTPGLLCLPHCLGDLDKRRKMDSPVYYITVTFNNILTVSHYVSLTLSSQFSSYLWFS